MIPVTEAKAKLNHLISSSTPTIISNRGKAAAVIVPYEQFQKISQMLKSQHENIARERAQALLNGDFEEFEEGTELLKD